MPDITQTFAAPAYWQQFEDLTVDLARLTFGDPSPEKVGRPGQAQHGLDVLVRASNGDVIGIQCKRREETDVNNDPLPGGTISTKDLTDAVALVENHPAKPDLFILATTAKPDTAIQTFAAQLTHSRRKASKFAVRTWSWGDYEAMLNRDAGMQGEFYRRVRQGLTVGEQDLFLLALVAEAFSRPAFRDHLSIEHHDDFAQAIRDTQRALSTGELVDRTGRRIRQAHGGWRTLADPDLRRGMQAVSDALDGFRRSVLAETQAGGVSQQGDYFCVNDVRLLERLSEQRDRVIVALDCVLNAARMEPLGRR